jgi:hypothetical protein
MDAIKLDQLKFFFLGITPKFYEGDQCNLKECDSSFGNPAS